MRLHAPTFAVLPDIVGAGDRSLEHSERWLDRLPSLPWYLAVQDGMTETSVSELLPRVAGLFLGGTDAFKATASAWSALARRHGKRFHFARVSTLHRVQAARRSRADSVDSTQMLWSEDHWRRFERWVTDSGLQTAMPWDR